MHKINDTARRLARERSKTGWFSTLRERKQNISGAINQLHISMGKGHHLARSIKSHDRQRDKG